MPDVPLATRNTKLRNYFGEVVPIDSIDDPNCCLVVRVIRMHRVDKQIPQGVDVEASYLGFTRHCHDASKISRGGFSSSISSSLSSS